MLDLNKILILTKNFNSCFFINWYNYINIFYINLFFNLFFKKKKNFLMVWLRRHKKWKWKRLFFKRRIFKSHKYLFKHKYRFKNKNKLLNTFSQKLVLFFKHKTGVLKRRYDEKKTLLYKASYYIDLKRNRIKKRKRKMPRIRKKYINKMLFKKLRENSFLWTHYNVKNHLKFSKIFSKFSKKPKSNFILFFENSLLNIVLKIKLFVNKRDAIFFIKTIGIFVNGKLITHTNKVVFQGDVIQLTHHYSYFFYKTSFFKKIRKYLRKVKPRIYRLMRNKIDPYKQATNRVPKWIYKLINLRENKAIYFEYDYTMLIFMVVYMSYNVQNISYYSHYNTHSYLYRLYNWKYIV